MTPSSHCPLEVYPLMKEMRPVERGSPSWGESTGAFSHSCDTAKRPHLGEKREAWHVLGSPHGRVDMGFSVQRAKEGLSEGGRYQLRLFDPSAAGCCRKAGLSRTRKGAQSSSESSVRVLAPESGPPQPWNKHSRNCKKPFFCKEPQLRVNERNTLDFPALVA